METSSVTNATPQISDVPVNIFRDIEWKEFVCGWCAAFVNISITYPVNKMIFRQMLHGVQTHKAFLQLHGEGLYYLYRGMLPPLCQKTFSLSIMFGVYEEVRRPLFAHGTNPYVAKAIAGIVAGSTEAILMPFERIQTLLADSAYHSKFRNTFDAFRSVGVHYGVREYYRGLIPILLRNGPSNVCFFIIRDEFHQRFPKTHSVWRDTLREFVSGALIGALLSSLFFPLNVVKITIQSKLGGEFQHMFKVFVRVYRERGGSVRQIYYGVYANVTRSFFSWGIMNAAYENIKALVS